MSVFDFKLSFTQLALLMMGAVLLIILSEIFGALYGLIAAGFIALTLALLQEMRARHALMTKMKEQADDHKFEQERLIRDMVNMRLDLEKLRKQMVSLGTSAKTALRANREYIDDLDAEKRIIKALIDSMARIDLGESALEGPILPQDVGVVMSPSASEAQGAAEAPLNVDQLSEPQVLKLVRLAIEKNRIDLFLQPIVNLPQRKLRFYEMFSRIRIAKDQYLPAEKYITLARRDNILPVIDNLLLIRGLQLIRDTAQEELHHSYFCNVTSLTLNDQKFMSDLVEFIATHRALAPRIVFEMAADDLLKAGREVIEVLSGLSKLGCRFSMDQVRDIHLDMSLLEDRFVRFVKIDGMTILKEYRTMGGVARIKRLKQDLDSRGIDLIIEKVETEKQLRDLLDVEFDYGQGFLFGKPEISIS